MILSMEEKESKSSKMSPGVIVAIVLASLFVIVIVGLNTLGRVVVSNQYNDAITSGVEADTGAMAVALEKAYIKTRHYPSLSELFTYLPGKGVSPNNTTIVAYYYKGKPSTPEKADSFLICGYSHINFVSYLAFSSSERIQVSPTVDESAACTKVISQTHGMVWNPADESFRIDGSS